MKTRKKRQCILWDKTLGLAPRVKHGVNSQTPGYPQGFAPHHFAVLRRMGSQNGEGQRTTKTSPSHPWGFGGETPKVWDGTPTVLGRLLLVRHGESSWNKRNWFTGWVDVALTPQGIDEALECGRQLAGVAIDEAYTSTLVRAMETLLLVLAFQQKTPVVVSKRGQERQWGRVYSPEAQQALLPVYTDWRLNERYYGRLQGLNKEETRRRYGDEKYTLWRRSYDVAPPRGESLAMTARRTLPFFIRRIVPLVQSGKTILISAHGNSLRAIVMFLEGMTPEEVVHLEIPHAQSLSYRYEGGWHKEGVQ